MPNKLIEKRIASIVQSPELRQFTNRDGKALQINVQILGNDAIDRACADNGDVIAAMNYILSKLPEPKMFYLKALAMASAKMEGRSTTATAKYLSVAPRLFFDHYDHGKKQFAAVIREIENGEIIIEEREDTEGMSKGNGEV